MGFLKSLFYDGKKCYRCGCYETEYLSGNGDLSIFDPDMQKWIINNVIPSGYAPSKPDIYYCHRCKHYMLDYPSTRSFRGRQYYFTYEGQIYRK